MTANSWSLLSSCILKGFVHTGPGHDVQKQHTQEFGIWQLGLGNFLGGSIVDQSQDHAVQINEEAEQMEAQFNHGLLHMGLKLPSVVDLSGVEHPHVTHRYLHVPVNIPGCYRQVEEENEPVHGHQHQHSRQALANQFWNYPFVQLGAASSRVYVVTF